MSCLPFCQSMLFRATRLILRLHIDYNFLAQIPSTPITISYWWIGFCFCWPLRNITLSFQPHLHIYFYSCFIFKGYSVPSLLLCSGTKISVVSSISLPGYSIETLILIMSQHKSISFLYISPIFQLIAQPGNGSFVCLLSVPFSLSYLQLGMESFALSPFLP